MSTETANNEASAATDGSTVFPCERCDVDRNTPFCPVCGERLTDNEFIGHNIQHLGELNEEVSRECREASDRIREMESRHKCELQPLKDRHSKSAAKNKAIRDAIDWARKNDIQHPGYRRN